MFTFVNVSFSESKNNIFLSNRLLNNTPSMVKNNNSVISEGNDGVPSEKIGVMSNIAEKTRSLIAAYMMLASVGAMANQTKGDPNSLNNEILNENTLENNTLDLKNQILELKNKIEEVKRIEGYDIENLHLLESIVTSMELHLEEDNNDMIKDLALKICAGLLIFLVSFSIGRISKSKIKTGVSDQADKNISNLLDDMIYHVFSTLEMQMRHGISSSNLLITLDDSISSYISNITSLITETGNSQSSNSGYSELENDSLNQDIEILQEMKIFTKNILILLSAKDLEELKKGFSSIDDFNENFCSKFYIRYNKSKIENIVNLDKFRERSNKGDYYNIIELRIYKF
jgi:hypothetical protein